MKKLIVGMTVLAIFLTVAVPASAGHRYHYGSHHGRGVGTGVVIGIASAVVLGGIIHHATAYRAPVVYVPAPPPQVIVVQPAPPPPARWVPGHWESAPQASAYYYDVWVPDHYNDRGEWVQGHYERRTRQQQQSQVWVEGHWE